MRALAHRCLVGGLVVACGPSAEPAPPVDEAPAEDQAIPQLEVDDPVAEWGAAEVEAAVEHVLGDDVPTPVAPRDAYLALMAEGDEVCPGDPLQILDAFLTGCTSSSGIWYAGISEWQEQHSVDHFGKFELELDMWALLGDFEIVDEEGREFHSGGHVAAWSLQLAGMHRRGAEMSGSWLWEGHDGWLDQEMSASMSYLVDSAGSARSLVIDGGLTVQGVTLHMEELTFGQGCPAHPQGELDVRDPSGSWHRISLEACEPCGPVSYGGAEPHGEACFDFEGLVDAVIADLDDWP